MRQPIKKTIVHLLDGKDRLVIPKYQRGYDWKESQEVKDFFNDISDCIKSENNELFLGSMIFDVSLEKKNIKEIIDGQQRITTIMIALIACRDYAKKVLKKDKIVQSIQEKISVTDEIGDVIDIKFEPSKTIDHVFKNMISSEWDGEFEDSITVGGKKRGVVYQNRKIKPVYEHAYSWVEEYCSNGKVTELQRLDRFKKLLGQIYSNTYIISIEVENKEDAFEIFERTNARGRNLEIGDLLKNYLFSKEKELDDSVESSWEILLNNSDNSLPRMLKYFYVSRRGYTPNRELYRSIRFYSQDHSISTFAEELKVFSYFYKAIKGKTRGEFQDWLKNNGYSKSAIHLNEAGRSVGALNLFSITQAYPLIYSALSCFKNSKEEDFKKIINFLRLLESYHFINNRIGTSIGNEVEQLYAKFSQDFFESNDFACTYEKFRAELTIKFETKDKFVASIKSTLYEGNTGNINICYAFDRLVNIGVKDGQRIDLLDYHYKAQDVIGSFDIDHIVSQHESKEINDPLTYDSIGNLMVIPKQINGIISNKKFTEKIDIYRNPSKYKNNIKHIPAYMKEFADESKSKKEWKKTDIEARTKDLSIQLYNHLTEGYRYK